MEALLSPTQQSFNWEREVKKFDESKAGVKGLVDSGITKIPKIFIHRPELLSGNSPPPPPPADQLQIPMIDLEGIERCERRRNEAVGEISRAASTWGFFQMVNHGIPIEVMEGLIGGARKFHEQPRERKLEYYGRELKGSVKYYSNEHLDGATAANWRDSLAFHFGDGKVDPNLLPLACRREVEEYMKCMVNLKNNLCELLSVALGLKRDHLSSMECMESQYMLCHYYPACPEPDRTLGMNKHSDQPFLTILLQDTIGGLQVLHQEHWVDVPTIPGILVANIGDLMQLITNDKFKSVQHRVLARSVGPRISAACFFLPRERNVCEVAYGPIKELLTDHNPPIYRQVLYTDVLAVKGKKNALDESATSVLSHFKL